METPIELRVRGRSDPSQGKEPTHPGRLASAIAGEAADGRPPIVTAIGKAACIIARQGLELAQSLARMEGTALMWTEEHVVVTVPFLPGDGAGGRMLQTRFVVSTRPLEPESDAMGDGGIGAGPD